MRRIIMAAVAVGTLLPGRFVEAGPPPVGDVSAWTVPAHSTHTFTRYFRAGQVVTVAVDGDDDTDLDLYADRPSGRVIAHDDDPGDECLVRFVAPVSGYYGIRVVNLGWVSNAYTILIDP
jgi:hypothetical protein